MSDATKGDNRPAHHLYGDAVHAIESVANLADHFAMEACEQRTVPDERGLAALEAAFVAICALAQDANRALDVAEVKIDWSTCEREETDHGTLKKTARDRPHRAAGARSA